MAVAPEVDPPEVDHHVPTRTQTAPHGPAVVTAKTQETPDGCLQIVVPLVKLWDKKGKI